MYKEIEFFPCYCKWNRDLAQVANAFIKLFEPNEHIINSYYKDLWQEADYESFLDTMAEYISSKDKRLGEPGFEPDLAYYIDEYFEEQYNSYDYYPDDDPVTIFFKTFTNGWSSMLNDYMHDYIENEDYVYMMYGIDAVGRDWAYNNMEYDVQAAFENDNEHGFQSMHDLKEVLENMNSDFLKEDVYDAGSLGYHCEDCEDFCEVGHYFLGNGEEEICLDENLEPPFNFKEVPSDLIDTDYYVDDNFEFAYTTLTYLIYFYYEWEDVITSALENGFEEINGKIVKKIDKEEKQ